MEREFKTVNELPENPLDMPPPYWRSSGAILQITSALEDICTFLRALRDVHPRIKYLISDYFKLNPESPEDDEKFGEIAEPLWELESKISLKCEIAVFMAAIEAEDLINQTCVYNLHKDIAESLETLSPPNKLLIVSASLSESSVKGTRANEAIKKLSTWRNSYAHGHCTDRPTKTLRHNHLIAPDDYPSVPQEIEHMLAQLDGYLALSEYLRSISKNEYTSKTSVHDSEIKDYLDQIRCYKFIYKDNGQVYDLNYV